MSGSLLPPVTKCDLPTLLESPQKQAASKHRDGSLILFGRLLESSVFRFGHRDNEPLRARRGLALA